MTIHSFDDEKRKIEKFDLVERNSKEEFHGSDIELLQLAFPKLGLTGGRSWSRSKVLRHAPFSSCSPFSQRSRVVVKRERVRERGTDVAAARSCLGIIAIGRSRGSRTRDAATPCVYRTTWNFARREPPANSGLWNTATQPPTNAFHAPRIAFDAISLVSRILPTHPIGNGYEAIHLRDWCSS